MTLRYGSWVARTGTALVLLALTSGCYSVSRVPAGYVTTQKPLQVVVRDADGALFAVDNPTIVADSLVGSEGGQGRLAVNLREVDAMLVRKFSRPKTYGLVAGLTAGTGLIFLGAAQSGILGDCFRIVNKNNKCISEVDQCKYDACDGM
jgi:hypothetical protein